MPMWAKRYLQEIQRLEELLSQRLEELSSLKTMYGLRGCNLSEKVQTSTKGDTLESSVIKIIELEKEVKALIDEFTEKKKQTKKELISLSNQEYSELLYMRYIRYLAIKEMARELQNSENAVKRKLKRAEKMFENTVDRILA